MPGTAMHHMIVERIMAAVKQNQSLGNLDPDDYQKLQTLLSDPKHLPYLYLGSQGPDFLFFNTRDWHPLAGNVANITFEVTDFIRSFKEMLLELVPDPILDLLAALGQLGDEVIQSSSTLTEIQQLFGDLNNVLTGLLTLIEEKAKEFITDWVNPFDNILTHPYRDGVPADDPDEWWYFDALHYRKTGTYAKLLLESTSAITTPEHIYALGHMSHVGADTVGHAYVNINSGGPYRAQPQRHRVAENFQDVFNYSLSATSAQKDINRSRLHELYNFSFDGTTAPDEDPRLPDDLAALITDSINKVYQVDEGGNSDPDFGPPVSIADIQSTYRLWYKWWRSTTETGILPVPVPYSFSGELREVWEQTLDNLEGIGDFLEGAVDNASNGGILSILALLAALAIAAVAAALALVDAVLGAITTLTVSTIRAAACLIYEQVYNAYQLFRLGVALNGLAYPMVEHLGEPVMQQFTDPSQPDATGANATMFTAHHPLPRWTPDEAEDFPEKHLIYPPLRVTPSTGEQHGERRPLLGAPSSYLTQHSSFYGWGDISMSAEVIDQLAKLQEIPPGQVIDRNGQPSDHEKETSAIIFQGKKALGNAVTFTGELYRRWRKSEPVPDFNLDSDRGYAYLCWAQTDDLGEPNTPSRLAVQPPKNATPNQVLDAIEAEVKLAYIPPAGAQS